MPKIKPFCGIRPNPAYAGEVVLDIENLSLEEAKIIRQENPYSYVNMLVPKLDNLFLRGSKNELAFKKINENFEDFLDKGILIRDQIPSIYIYRISRNQNSQTGIWTISSIDDYLENKIRKHEHTRPEREHVLANYMQQTGIDANPVLITYNKTEEIEFVIKEVTQSAPDLQFRKQGALHELWKMDHPERVEGLVAGFDQVPVAYIADGHHRAAAAALLALNQRKLNPSFTGEEEYNFFTSVYMSLEELEIYPFYRLIRDLNGLSVDAFVAKLAANFSVLESNEIVIPDIKGSFGLYTGKQWYLLVANKYDLKGDDDVIFDLDVSILQDKVFNEILAITDPRNDPRISFSGAVLPIHDMITQVNDGDYAALFTLYPVTADELTRVADSNQVMPPKSTWFEPKFQAGLLIHQI